MFKSPEFCRFHHGLCHGMWEMFFQTGGNTERLILTQLSKSHNVLHCRLRLCQCSCLIKYNRFRLGYGFQILSAFDRHMV